MVFVPIWSIAVYAVVAHWVWAPGRLAVQAGVLDYAGGLVVEIVSGASALALALVLGPRIGFKVDAMRPHNLPFVLLGVGLLWFGWFGFNAGSALAANGTAAAIFLNTLVAGCLGMLGWLSVEQIRDGKPTTFGAASGVVAGLVAITPSCGTVNTLGAAVVGLAAGIVCSFAIGMKFRFGYDDSLDVVGVHFVGGVVGVLLDRAPRHRGDDRRPRRSVLRRWARPARQAGAGDAGGRRCTRSRCRFMLAKLIDRVMGFRVSAEDETAGVDFSQHAETAYAEGVHGHQPTRRPLFGDPAYRPAGRRGTLTGWAPVSAELIPVALVVALSPVSVLPALLLVLYSTRPRSVGLAFLFGWLAGLAALTVVFLNLPTLLGDADQGTPRWQLWVRIIIGIALIAGGCGGVRRDRPGRSPAWLDAIGRLSPSRTATMGVGLAVVNPKIVVACAAAGFVMARAEMSPLASGVTVGYFVVLAAQALPCRYSPTPWRQALRPPARSLAAMDTAHRDRDQRADAAKVIGMILVYSGLRAL